VDVPLVEETATGHGDEDDEDDENEQLDLIRTHSIHLLSLEPEVLERFGCVPVELRGDPVLTSPRRQIALGDPDRGTMAEGGELFEGALGLVEGGLRLLQASLLEK
jgi:hypothetical protein